MAKYDQIKIFQSAYVLTLEIYKASRNFSKEYKYTLGEKLKICAHELLDLIMKTNSLPDREKIEYFPLIDFKKENIRIYLRLAYDLKTISSGRLKEFNEKIEEIGRQLGGWQKWVSRQ